MHGMRKIEVLIFRILGVLTIFAILISAFFLLEGGYEVKEAKFLFVGTKEDADCSILLSREQCVMVDTGEEQDAEKILSVLKKESIEKIDCLILTHPDKDHIGGAAQILDEVAVELIVAPYYIQENERYTVLLEKIADMGIHFMTPSRNRQLQYGDMEIRILPPDDISYNNDNNYSLVTLVKHGDVKLLLAGDAERKRLEELKKYVFSDVNVYKVPHHGRNSTASAEMIERVHPKYAVITAQSVEIKIAEAIRKVGSEVSLTVPDKDVVFESDGIKISKKS
ncbi:MBL fold metallo-hydrolase [Blautia schinkii]|nr:MBL fold metallo-hydrolase [Blautia schinkii]